MSEVLHVTIRDGLGTRRSRQLRQQGRVPAVMYGHGKENVNLAVQASEIEAALRHGAQLVDVQGDVTQSALIKDIQWDTFGNEVLHIDLARVSVDEAVDVTVGVELVGEAPGIKEGGVVEHVLHEVEIRCPAGAIPDRFEVKINELHLGQTITAAELQLPDQAELLTDPDSLIATCSEPVAAPAEEEAVAGEAAEPEVIGRAEGEGEGTE
jgi:large subunit ribosomal protein L25